MNAHPSTARAVVLLAGLAAAACSSTAPRAEAPAPQAASLPVRAALVFGGPFAWKEQEKAFDLAGAPGPVGLDQPLRPLATLHWPACPARKLKPGMGANERIAAPVSCQAKLKFGIDADGRVSHTQLLHAAQSAGVEPSFNFGFSAVSAVNQWRFEPPRRSGQPADICCVELSID